LNKFTPGTNWNGCGKHDMLEAVKRANSPNACGWDKRGSLHTLSAEIFTNALQEELKHTEEAKERKAQDAAEAAERNKRAAEAWKVRKATLEAMAGNLASGAAHPWPQAWRDEMAHLIQRELDRFDRLDA
jgi:hypothetical protein